MSIPPVDYSVPPPRLDMPPPVPLSRAPSVNSSSQMYSHLSPYNVQVPSIEQPAPFASLPTLPPLNYPPPVAYPQQVLPNDMHSASSPFPPPPIHYLEPWNSWHKSNDYSLQSGNIKTSSDYHTGKSSSFREMENRHYLRDTASSSTSKYSSHRERSYDRDKERELRYRESRRSRSPCRYRRYSRSPTRSSHRDRERYRDKYDDKYEYGRKYDHRPHEYERSSHSRDYRSHSRSYDSHSGRRYYRSPSRRSHHSLHRESHGQSRSREKSQQSGNETSQHHRKPMTDREKILEEFRKNYCKTSEDFIEKIEQWSKEHNPDEEEKPKMWYRSSPAELYYTPAEGGAGVQQTAKLEKLCETFFQKLIERGRSARPGEDELPPIPAKTKLFAHQAEQRSSSSSESDDCLDEESLEGYSDRIMMELRRKQRHPRRLHPEIWFNNTGEMNSSPVCRCSARARRLGMCHGVYAGEEAFPRCDLAHSNLDKLYHYRITVSPPTNFLIKAPTIIGHDEHEFLFSGFSLFSHYRLARLPACKVIRFNIEYTVLYVEEPAPHNYTVAELNLFEEFLFYELLELVDLDLGKATETSCSQFHFMPRFVRYLPEGGCEVLSMCEVLKYLIDESGLLIAPESLTEIHKMDHFTWLKFVDRIKGMIVTYPGKKPCSVRVDQLDRNPPNTDDTRNPKAHKSYYPEIVHFGIRPPQFSYAGNPEYQKCWRYYVKYRHLIANMAKPTYKERQKLAAKEARLQEMRTQCKMKRDVTIAISSEGFYTTGLMCDVVQHAMLIPVLVRHLRFHKSLDCLEREIGYVFKQRALLQTALTHPSYRENFGTNPDHARNSLTNCGIRQPEYGDRKIHYTRKKGIVTLINIMSRFGKASETESGIKHNERLEFLGDAVVEFLSSIHLFRMFPGLTEGGLATFRASIVQNQHLAQLAKNISLEQYMLYAHGSDLCRDVVMRHAMANCFEALMGALFLDAGIEVADRVFALALWHQHPDLLEVWAKDRAHPLQEQEPLGDRKYIKDFEFLQRLTKFEESIGVQFKHIRLLARAFTDRSVGFTHLTLGSNQRLEFLGDTVLQLVVSDKLYRHFPDHHEGHLSLLRSSLVNKRTQAMVCDDLNMAAYAIYNNPKAKPTTKKHKADLLEAFLGALFIDKSLEYCQVFCNACLFPRLQEFIMNQDWNDPKSKLQQCCLTLRSMEGGEPDIPVYKVIECLGPTNTRVYTVGVYFRGRRLAAARGHSIQEAEMNAANEALSGAHELFPQLDHQNRVIAQGAKARKKKSRNRHGPRRAPHPEELASKALERKRHDDKVPKAYRLDKQSENSDDESVQQSSEDEVQSPVEKSDEDSGLDSDLEPISDDKLENVQVSSLLSDMQKLKEDLIRRNEYHKLKEKCRNSESDNE